MSEIIYSTVLTRLVLAAGPASHLSVHDTMLQRVEIWGKVFRNNIKKRQEMGLKNIFRGDKTAGACLHLPEEDLETGHEGFKVIVSVVLCVGVVSHVSEHLRVFCRYNICQKN